MLDALKRQFSKMGMAEVDMAEIDGMKAQLQDLMEQLSAKEVIVAELNETVTDREQKLAAALEAAQTLTEEVETIKATHLKEKSDARKELIVAAVGEARADSVFEMSKDMDDKNFSVLLDAVKLSAAVEAKTEMFTETGVSGVVAPSAVEESAEMKLLKKEFSNK